VLLGDVGGNNQERELKVNCYKHGKYTFKQTLFSGTWLGPDRCPACYQEQKATHQKQTENANNFHLESKNRELRSRFITASGVPPRFKQKTLDNYVVQGDVSSKILAFCRDYVANFKDYRKQGRSAILCGTMGTGKTHLSCAMAMEIINQHVTPAVYARVSRVCRHVKETYSRDSAEQERDVINSYVRPELLILDEVGVQYGSDTENLIMFDIINERYEQMKPTILISNLSLTGLKGYVGDRVVDRMKENGGNVLNFTWESYRK
jgi:DNA replication protein DnaC